MLYNVTTEEPWLQLVLSGQKTLEVRGSPYKGKYYFGTKGRRCKTQ